jgi:glycosidase
MQWNDTVNAGFSETTPWLPVPPSYKTYNVADESKDPNSILNVYRRLLALRRTNPALANGSYIALNQDDPNVLSYLRKQGDETVLVVLNMSASPQKVSFNLAPHGFASPKLSVLLSTSSSSATATAGALTLEPFAVYIAKVTK